METGCHCFNSCSLYCRWRVTLTTFTDCAQWRTGGRTQMCSRKSFIVLSQCVFLLADSCKQQHEFVCESPVWSQARLQCEILSFLLRDKKTVSSGNDLGQHCCIILFRCWKCLQTWSTHEAKEHEGKGNVYQSRKTKHHPESAAILLSVWDTSRSAVA